MQFVFTPFIFTVAITQSRAFPKSQLTFVVLFSPFVIEPLTNVCGTQAGGVPIVNVRLQVLVVFSAAFGILEGTFGATG
jgi:hypothetical protein